jgi:hypothetical protein
VRVASITCLPPDSTSKFCCAISSPSASLTIWLFYKKYGQIAQSGGAYISLGKEETHSVRYTCRCCVRCKVQSTLIFELFKIFFPVAA